MYGTKKSVVPPKLHFKKCLLCFFNAEYTSQLFELRRCDLIAWKTAHRYDLTACLTAQFLKQPLCEKPLSRRFFLFYIYKSIIKSLSKFVNDFFCAFYSVNCGRCYTARISGTLSAWVKAIKRYALHICVSYYPHR
jgi:hypothetical protein